MTPSPQSSRSTRRCPICAKSLPDRTARFCSDRCTQVDLGRWLQGDYAIPAVEEDPPEKE